jgi:ATP-dependent helicase HrpB
MAEGAKLTEGEPDLPLPRLLLHAFPERIAKRREEGEGRFILSQGRGVRLPPSSGLAKSPFIIAVQVDAGGRAEGMVHLAEPVTEDLLRQEMGARIEVLRRVEWDKKEGKVLSNLEERLGAVQLSAKPFQPSDEEAAPLLCEAIWSGSGRITFRNEVRQLQGRVALMR